MEDDDAYNALAVERSEGPQQRGEPVADVVESDAHLALEHARQESLRSSVLFPNSWQTADMKHVVDNLLHECLEAMATFAATTTSRFLGFWGPLRSNVFI